MTNIRTIKRYNAYYHGWCLAFGEHSANFDEARDVNFLVGEDRMGLILSPGLRKQAQREFLGHHEAIPELVLSAAMVRMNKFMYRLNDDTDRENVQHLIDFLLGSQELHMFLCSHFFYQRTRIITFSTKKPIVIMYKEMQPLQLIVE